MRAIVYTLAVFVTLFALSRGVADAALRVCNASYEPASVAIAALEPSTSGARSHSEGWFDIDAQECQIVIDTDLNPDALYYVYAKAPQIVWTGKSGATRDAPFCTNFAEHFNYIDRTADLCTGAGEQMLQFINEPVAGPTWTVLLVSP